MARPALPWRAALLAFSLALASVTLAAVPTQGQAFGPGCDPDKRSVAHGGDGVAVDGPPRRMACATETGQYTGETTIGVTDDGTVWFSAADWEWALVRSRDLGATWERFEVPGPQALPGCGGSTPAMQAPCDDSQQARYNTVADAFLWVDPSTSRIHWAKTYGYALCSSLNISADLGSTWESVAAFGCPGGDYEKIAGGPRPGSDPGGYVLYGCANGPAPTFVVGPARVCYRSHDGGITWLPTGAPVVPSPRAPGCLHFQESHAVAPDGTLWMPLGCALDPSRVMVARSVDEATTWDYVDVPTGGVPATGDLIGGVSLAIDEAGTVFVLWTATDGALRLAATADGGGTWRGPFTVSAPGVTVGMPRGQVAAGEAGHVAIAYYGLGDRAGVLHGWLTESFDADGDDPTFHSVQLDTPDDPLYVPVESGTLPRNDYLGVTIGPDGTPWAALVKLVSPTPDDEGFIQSTGFAGRLADHPATAGTTPGSAPAGTRPVTPPPADQVAGPLGSPLPATGGGLALVGLILAAAGMATRRGARTTLRSPT